jgi:invasion protein IalB
LKNSSPAMMAKSSQWPMKTQTTTAVFGDWTLRCQKSGVGAQARRSCEIDQSATVQGQSAPFSQIAVGKATPNDPLRVTVLVPANVAFPSSVRLLFDEKDNQSIDLIWARCLPGGCFAVETLTDEMLKRWRTLTPPAKATFKNGAGQDVVIPVSFRGFAQAIDALAKEK